jgi:hypothetical protein
MDPVYSVMIGLTCLAVGYVVAKVSLGLTIQKKLDEAERELRSPTILKAWSSDKSIGENCEHYWLKNRDGKGEPVYMRLPFSRADEGLSGAVNNAKDNPFTK